VPALLSVLPRYGLMYVAFSGHVKAAEGVAAFEDYMQHPNFSNGQKHLIDFSKATGFEGDFTNLMALQAQLVDAIMPNQQVLFVFCAPSPLAQELAQYSVVDVIGLPGLTFADLTEKAT